MAGIGFELKGLFQKKGVMAKARAYGYAGVICAGPMLLGVLLILGIMLLCEMTGALRSDRELLICMITYTLLASLLVTGFFSMAVTRFLADMLYEEKTELVMPSFWGSCDVMLVSGGILYGIFLLFSGVPFVDRVLLFMLFGELVVVWNAMGYLTAIKDYKGILKAFASAVFVTFAVGYLLLLLGIPHVEALLIAVSAGYGLMMLWDIVLLYRYFPKKKNTESSFLFLHWLDEYFPLALTGFF